ncbi:MAG: hypothetical protein WCK18_05435 [Prolixibacteraceae bacterium]
MKKFYAFLMLTTWFVCLNMLVDAKPQVKELSAIAISPGDGHYYWFGYYDKLLSDPKDRYVLAMRTNFEHRTPAPEDVIQVGMIDLKKGNLWTTLGESRAWCWQQGCMLQFVPGSPDEVIWNDREGDHFVSHIINIKTMKVRTLPKPVYTLSPDGRTALGLDFARLQIRRPGYGYVGVIDKTLNVQAPDNTGIYRIDLKSGESKLLITPAQIVGIPMEGVNFQLYYHWFNHLLISPDGSRFIFLHRWHTKPNTPFETRMFTAKMDGTDLYVLDGSGKTSHFIWRDNNHVTMFTQPVGMKERFYLFKDKSKDISVIGEELMPTNGHCTYIPGTNNEWILCDTYPETNARLQSLYLYHVPTNRKVVLGKFHSPPVYNNPEWRCDLHPWSSRDGKTVFFESTHEGTGRRVYMIDISGIIGNKK